MRDWNLRVILNRIWGAQQLDLKSWAVQRAPADAGGARDRGDALARPRRHRAPLRPARRVRRTARSRTAQSPDRGRAMTVTLPRPGEVGPVLPETPYVGLVPYGRGRRTLLLRPRARAEDRHREPSRAAADDRLRPERRRQDLAPARRRRHDLRRRSPAAGGCAVRVCTFSSWRDDPLPATRWRRSGARRRRRWARRSRHAGAGRAASSRRSRGWTQQRATLLVVLDQFEDYFLYHPDEDGEGTFVAELPRVVNEPNLRVNFLLSIREDALGEARPLRGPHPEPVRELHPRRAPDARRRDSEAVEGPIAEWNRRQAEGASSRTRSSPRSSTQSSTRRRPGGSRSPRPSNGALADEAGGGDEVEAPFLQLVMERLWRATVAAGSHELTRSTLEELGGAQRIVENHLLEALGSLDAPEQAVAADALPLPRQPVEDEDRALGIRPRRVDETTRARGRRPSSTSSAAASTAASCGPCRRLRTSPRRRATSSSTTSSASRSSSGAARYEHDRDRRATIRRFAVAGGVLFALVAAFAAIGIWALIQRSDADRAASSASSLGLTAAANGQLAGTPECGAASRPRGGAREVDGAGEAQHDRRARASPTLGGRDRPSDPERLARPPLRSAPTGTRSPPPAAT